MILITGARGNFGKAAISHLLKAGIAPSLITGLVRDTENIDELTSIGIEVKIGDYDNYYSLVKAFKGIDKLLFVSGAEGEDRLKQHENVIKAAIETGIKHIIYTSVQRTNETINSPLYLISHSHIETEKLIKSSGIPFTILRNNLYLDVLPTLLGKDVLNKGVFFPAGNGKIAFALRSEMAEAAVNILINDNHENKEYFISNSENITFQEITDILSNLTGKNLTYLDPSKEEYIQVLSNAGVTPAYIEMFAGFAEAINDGEFENTNNDLEILLGRKPTTIKAFLAESFSPSN